MKRKLFLGSFVLLFMCSCGKHADTLLEKTVVVPVYKMKTLEYEDMPFCLFSVLDMIVLDSDACLLSQIDKAIYRDDKIYLLDWLRSNIFVYDMEGTVLSVLTKQDRDEREYLQITDFDVDKNGHIWLWDEQKDRLLEYGNDGLLSSKTPDCDFLLFRCLDDNRFLLQLAPWDDSKYAGKGLLLSDSELNGQNAFVDYGDNIDPDYKLPSLGFSDNGTNIFYHRPIDDNVYRINAFGDIDSVYRFDFGTRAVPEKVRGDIERNLGNFTEYTALVKTVCVVRNCIVGTFYDSRKYKDFIMDCRTGNIYLQSDEYGFLNLVGISEGKAVFRVLPGHDLPASFPVKCKAEYESGHEILAIMDIDALANRI